MNEMNKQAQIKKLRTYFKTKFNIAEDVLDYEAEVDSSLTYAENKTRLMDMLGKTEELTKTTMEKTEADAILNAEEEATLDFQKAIDVITQTKADTGQHYKNAIHYINMVAKGYSNSLILVSEGGLGKTYLVLTELKQNNINFAYRSGYATALSFYQDLWEIQNNPDIDVVFYDDMDLFFSDKKCIALLKPILWEVGNQRVVSYLSTTDKLKAPNKFNFTKTIIFCLNELPDEDNISLRALTSRALSYNISFSWKEKIKLFYEVAKKTFKEITDAEREMIVKYIEQHTTPATENLNIRTLIKAFNMFAYDRKLWKHLLKDILHINPYIFYIIEHETKPASEQSADFTKEFGLSRATFYRYKNKLRERRGL